MSPTDSACLTVSLVAVTLGPEVRALRTGSSGSFPALMPTGKGHSLPASYNKRARSSAGWDCFGGLLTENTLLIWFWLPCLSSCPDSQLERDRILTLQNFTTHNPLQLAAVQTEAWPLNTPSRVTYMFASSVRAPWYFRYSVFPKTLETNRRAP